MQLSEFNKLIEEFEKFYRRQLPPPAKKRGWEMMQHEPAAALWDAIDKCMLQHTSYMPDLQRLCDYCREAGQKIRTKEAIEREREAEKEKREFENGARKIFDPNQDNKQGRLTCRLVIAFLSGDISKEKYLEGVANLGQMYPNAGYMSVHSKWKRAWDC